MVRLTLTLLGTFQAGAGGRPITNFATDKARALLAYLAVEADRPHRRDTLAALLWPDWDDSGARSNLRLALHRLRETFDKADPALGDNLFSVTRETVQVNGTAVDVDVTRFDSLLDVCESHPHRLLHLCPSCLDQLTEAAALYDGELLAGLSISDAPGFEQWQLALREETGQRALALFYRLADAYEQIGEYERGLLYARRQLSLDPYREEAHRQVIRLYALQGERAAALAHFERARRLLAKELGVEPDPATLELAEQVRAGRLAASGSTPGNGHSGRVLLYHFPTRIKPFYGRAAEIKRLVARLASPGRDVSLERLGDPARGNDSIREGPGADGPGADGPGADGPGADGPGADGPPARLYTIVAPGGMGKTRLAIAMAEALAEQKGYTDGIYFVSLAELSSADLLPSALAATLNVNFQGVGDLTDQLIAFLRPKSALLVLDNFEHLMDGVDLVLRLLEETPRLTLLVTSRVALNIRPEERYYLGGMDEQAATEVFLGAASRIRPGFSAGPTALGAIRQIVRDVGGMPLAVELAAAWTRLMTTADIASRIRHDLDFLAANLRDLPERQRSMRVVFDQMWAMLDPPEQEALAMLSVLRGSFRLDAAEAISGASPAVIASLLDQSLVTASTGGWFELHELLRQYAAGKPDGRVIATAEENHAAYYLSLLGQNGPKLGRAGSKEALDTLRRNLANVRKAWEWTLAAGRSDELAAALTPLGLFYRFSGSIREGIDAFSAAQVVIQQHIESGRVTTGKGLPLIYELIEREALLYVYAGKVQEALSRLTVALSGWEALGNRRNQAQILDRMGYVNVLLGQQDEAKRLLGESLPVARELRDERLIASILHNQGNSLKATGQFEEGRALIEQSIPIYRRLGEMDWLIGAKNDLAVSYVLQNELKRGQLLFTEALELAEVAGDLLGSAHALIGLGAVAIDLYELDAAEEYNKRGQTISQDIGALNFLYFALANLGHIALLRGETEIASQYYCDVLGLTIGGDYQPIHAEVVIGLSALAVESRPDLAARWLSALWNLILEYGEFILQVFLTKLYEETQLRVMALLGESFEGWSAEGSALALMDAATEARVWAMEQGMMV